MKTTKPSSSKPSAPRALVTTLGDLISAAYDAAPGAGTQRLRLAMALLTASPLARQLHPHVVFTR